MRHIPGSLRSPQRSAFDSSSHAGLYGMLLVFAGNGRKQYQFRAHDEGVLQQLPSCVRDQLPIIFTRKGAIERNLLDTMVRNAATPNSSSLSDQQRMVREAHMRTYTQKKNSYYQYAAERATLKREQAGSRLFPGIQYTDPPAPAQFVAYDDRDGYRGWIPSTTWISGMCVSDCREYLFWV
jgi:hypothetical protein